MAGITPYKTIFKDLTSLVISSKELSLKFEGVNRRNQTINAYRVDRLHICGPNESGDLDFILAEFDYVDLNDEAIGSLKRISSKDFVSREQIVGFTPKNAGEKIKQEVMQKGIVLSFTDCFLIRVDAYLNVIKGGGGVVDYDFEIWGGYVALSEERKKKLESGVTL